VNMMKRLENIAWKVYLGCNSINYKLLNHAQV
jgi:hypothetical protein